jgi:hypothetical protein
MIQYNIVIKVVWRKKINFLAGQYNCHRLGKGTVINGTRELSMIQNETVIVRARELSAIGQRNQHQQGKGITIDRTGELSSLIGQ